MICFHCDEEPVFVLPTTPDISTLWVQTKTMRSWTQVAEISEPLHLQFLFMAVMSKITLAWCCLGVVVVHIHVFATTCLFFSNITTFSPQKSRKYINVHFCKYLKVNASTLNISSSAVSSTLKIFCLSALSFLHVLPYFISIFGIPSDHLPAFHITGS